MESSPIYILSSIFFSLVPAVTTLSHPNLASQTRLVPPLLGQPANSSFRLATMEDDYSEEVDEYTSAKKLVQRAADREALLKSSDVPSSSDLKSSADSSALSSSGLGADFSNLPLKPDHISRPCWTCPDGTIYLEAFHDLYPKAYDFLVAIAEPVARPEHLHEYKLTPYSLYAAVATNIETESIVKVLNRFSKNVLPEGVAKFIRECTKRYGKAKLVLKHNKFYVESEHPAVLRELLRDDLISQARVAEDVSEEGSGGGAASTANPDGFVVHTKAEEMEENLRMLREMDGDSSDDEEDEEGGAPKQKGLPAKTTVSFQVKGDSVEVVKRRAIDLDYPLMEEYDFRNDKVNPDVPMDLKPHTRIRRYQERSLSKVRFLKCPYFMDVARTYFRSFSQRIAHMSIKNMSSDVW